MVENKTRATEGDVIGFLETVEDDSKREDSFAILEMMSEVTGEKPKMWGPSITPRVNHVYIRRLEDVDRPTLTKLIESGVGSAS